MDVKSQGTINYPEGLENIKGKEIYVPVSVTRYQASPGWANTP